MKLFPIGAVLVAAFLALAPARAQQAAAHEQHQHDQTTAPKSGMMDHDKMMADMKAADARLQALADTMRSAQGDEKVRAIENVVSELVKNQIDMHQHMAMMHEHMMSQMPKK